MKTALILLTEIAGLIATFIIFLLIFNFFNIISLSKIYPRQLGWLPHQQLITQKQTPGAVTNNQSPILANFAKLKNQASDIQISKYTNSAARFSKPTAQHADPNYYASDAIFSGYDNQTIQIVTVDGILNLNFDQITLFQKYPIPTAPTKDSTSGGIIPKPIKYTQEDFFKNIVFGSTLQVLYSKPNLKAIQVNYIESIKPVL